MSYFFLEVSTLHFLTFVFYFHFQPAPRWSVVVPRSAWPLMKITAPTASVITKIKEKNQHRLLVFKKNTLLLVYNSPCCVETCEHGAQREHVISVVRCLYYLKKIHSSGDLIFTVKWLSRWNRTLILRWRLQSCLLFDACYNIGPRFFTIKFLQIEDHWVIFSKRR